ncbi:MAG: RDD family protein [Acidimicrobiia bacterium]
MRKVLDIGSVEYASFPQRIIARIIDNIICFGIFYLFLTLIGEKLTYNADKIDGNLGLGNLIWFFPLFVIAYEIPMMANYGTTLGKRMMGLCVVRSDGIIGIGLDKALIRFCTPIVVGIIPFIGFFLFIGAQCWYFFDPNRQNLADKAAKTYVIRTPKGLYSKIVEPPEVIEGE